ncbi:MAG: nodulation protein NfeD [Gemmatimonadaceae bacterium]|nr:nodulation protein NfeD [Gemmatimonadaceae bacterium]
MSHFRPCTRMARWVAGAAIALLPLAGLHQPLGAQSREKVYVIPIEGMIDMGLAPFVKRALDEAVRERAAAVIIEINTFGGRVDAAVAIRDALLSTTVPTVAYINRRAISAGALISLAAGRIAIADGGTIGAATPVNVGASGESSPVDEKSVSYVRKEFRSTADSRNRPPEIAEAMVDEDVAIEGLVEKGKLLTLTTNEAIERGVADFRAANIEEVLARVNLTGAEVRRIEPNWGENIVRLITHPVLASLLLSVAMLGILIELRTPGLGLAGALGVTSLALVIGGHWIVALVGWEELLLISLGLLLIAVEVFVIPGFGAAGVLGIAALLGGMTLGMVGEGATIAAIASAAGRVAFATVMAVVSGIVVLRYLPASRFGKDLTLATELPAGTGYAAAPARDSAWLGRDGRVISPLRPAGIVDMDGERVDVVSEGEMIETGATVVVSRVDGNRIVVRRHRATTMEGTHA